MSTKNTTYNNKFSSLLSKIREDPKYLNNEDVDVLIRLIRWVFLSLGIDYDKWTSYVTEYLNKKYPGRERKHLMSLKESIESSISHQTLSWKRVLVVIKILKPVRVTMVHTAFTSNESLNIKRQVKMVQGGDKVTFPLKHFFKEIAGENFSNQEIWKFLNSVYAEKYAEENNLNRSNVRNNNLKLLVDKNNYTWYNYVTALRILGIERITIYLELSYPEDLNYSVVVETYI